MYQEKQIIMVNDQIELEYAINNLEIQVILNELQLSKLTEYKLKLHRDRPSKYFLSWKKINRLKSPYINLKQIMVISIKIKIKYCLKFIHSTANCMAISNVMIHALNRLRNYSFLIYKCHIQINQN